MSSYARRLAREDHPLLDLGTELAELDLGPGRSLVGMRVDVFEEPGGGDLHLPSCTELPRGASPAGTRPLGNLSEHLGECCVQDLPPEHTHADALTELVLALRGGGVLHEPHLKRLKRRLGALRAVPELAGLEGALDDSLEVLAARREAWLETGVPEVLLRAAVRAEAQRRVRQDHPAQAFVSSLDLERATGALEAERRCAHAELKDVTGELLVRVVPASGAVIPDLRLLLAQGQDELDALSSRMVSPEVLRLPRRARGLLEAQTLGTQRRFHLEVTDVSEELPDVLEAACVLLKGSPGMSVLEALEVAQALA